MNVASMQKAFMAGVAGTVVMTVFSFISHYLRIPPSDFHGMISSHFHLTGVVSWVVYFGFGVGLAYLYGTYFKARLPAHSWGQGVIYSLILWGVMEAVLMPVFGMGFFAGSIGAAAAAFVGMSLYGATVGFLYDH